MKKEWRWLTIGEVVSVMRNGVNCEQDKQGIGDRITRIETISRGEFDFQRVGYSRLSAKDKSKARLQRNDILFSHINSPVHVGKTAILREETEVYHGINLMLFRASESIDPLYLHYYLQSLYVRGFWRSLAKQSVNQASVNQTDIKSVGVPVPSLETQRRIVAILDKAFAAIDRAKKITEKNLANAKEVFESQLNEEFTQASNPQWESRNIGQLGTVYDGPHATPKTIDQGPIFLGISALKDGFVDLDSTRHVTPADFKTWTRRVKPQENDIVFSYETRLGQIALIPPGLECCLGRRMGLIRLDTTKIDPWFFTFQYLSGSYQEYLKSKTVQGATVDRLSIKEFPSFTFKLAPLYEQKQVVEKLKKLQYLTSELLNCYMAKLLKLDELKAAILHTAFTGRM